MTKIPSVAELIHGDCLEEMKKIPDGSVDMVLTDPPYGTTACKWVTVIPLEPMWEQLKRVIKPNGAIVMTASQPFTSALVMSNVKMFKYCWVWKKSKPGGFLNSKNAPLKITEDICVFSNGTIANKSKLLMQYFPQGLVEINKTVNAKSPRSNTSTTGRRPSRNNNSYVRKYGNYPNNLLEVPSSSEWLHPTQKPVALLEYLIKTYTNETETVLDFTMGSGTTGVACKNLNRNFIGIELDETYFNIAKERINNTYD